MPNNKNKHQKQQYYGGFVIIIVVFSKETLTSVITGVLLNPSGSRYTGRTDKYK